MWQSGQPGREVRDQLGAAIWEGEDQHHRRHKGGHKVGCKGLGVWAGGCEEAGSVKRLGYDYQLGSR
eukprot:113536-Heterocapsa_arctica.AAC.1